MTGARRRRHARAVVIGLAVAALTACGGGTPPARSPTFEAAGDTRILQDRPPLVLVTREGDPRGALAVAVSTEGIAPERGAEVAVALGALVEARLPEVGVTPAWDGFRARALVASDADAEALATRVRIALLTPAATEAELARVQRKLAALARRPMADAALADAARCTGEPYARAGAPSAVPIGIAELEAWRSAAAGLGRVTFATAGAQSLGEAVARALANGPAWPRAAATKTDDAATDAKPQIYDATGDVPAGAARATLAVHVPRAEQAVLAATQLADPKGPFAVRLGGLEAQASVRDVTATAHVGGGCVAVTLELAARDLAGDPGGRVAMAVALAQQELAVEVSEAAVDPSLPRALARRAGDPRDAAELAAWWSLTSGARPAGSAEHSVQDLRITTAIGLATGRDAAPGDATIATRAQAVRADLDRAVLAWHEPVVEARTRVEKGQGELWLLLGSPCGTLPEVETDAGLGAAFTVAAAARADEAGLPAHAHAEPWVTPEGLGIVVHGPAMPGETPTAHARRLADLAARSFAAEPIDRVAVARARGRLLEAADDDAARALVAVAEGVVPGHPSWLAPMGPADALGRSSDAAVVARAAGLRAGPLRVAVLANTDAAQGDALVRAVDRWIARRPGEARVCAMPSTPAPPRPGTYAVDAEGGKAEAWLAVPLPAGDDAARAAATLTALALDGEGGLLAKALGGGLARAWSARVVGPARASALVVRITSVQGALDAAVAQTRGLLDRLRQGSLQEADRVRALQARERLGLAAALDPRVRLAALWLGTPAAASSPAPSLDALRAFASATLRDEALVIVAARAPRKPPQ